MKCNQAGRLFKFGGNFSETERPEVTIHMANCEDCRQRAVIESLAGALIKAHSSTYRTAVDVENPYLISRIKARILELSEHGVGSWESAVLNLRGWLIAFGATAAILLSISVQGQVSNTPLTLDGETDVTAGAAIGEEFISGLNSIPYPGISTEGVNNAHK
jgi:hypothetical protein